MKKYLPEPEEIQCEYDKKIEQIDSNKYDIGGGWPQAENENQKK